MLLNTTVVLVGSGTYERRWVKYEIIKSIAVGNKIISVHINSIKGKNQRTKVKGANPLYYLGYKYSDDGKTIDFYELKNGKWYKYKDMKGYTLKNTASESKRGKVIRLSNVYSCYDWIEDDGYNNFSKWVE